MLPSVAFFVSRVWGCRMRSGSDFRARLTLKPELDPYPRLSLLWFLILSCNYPRSGSGSEVIETQ